MSITISEHGLKEVRKAQVRVEREHLGHSLHAIDEQAAVRRSKRAVVRVEAGLRAETRCLTSSPRIFHSAMIEEHSIVLETMQEAREGQA